jgi:hypothetical protein
VEGEKGEAEGFRLEDKVVIHREGPLGVMARVGEWGGVGGGGRGGGGALILSYGVRSKNKWRDYVPYY